MVGNDYLYIMYDLLFVNFRSLKNTKLTLSNSKEM